MSGRDEREARTQFAERYAIATADVNDKIERSVIGAAWGANGYTTVAQADELGRQLDLAPGRGRREVGIGRGWRVLSVAARTGCTVIGADMARGARATAGRRARAENLQDRVALVAAGGADQPFRRASFDAI